MTDHQCTGLMLGICISAFGIGGAILLGSSAIVGWLRVIADRMSK